MNRRTILETVAMAAGCVALGAQPTGAQAQPSGAGQPAVRRSPFVTARDGTRIFVQDWAGTAAQTSR
jgi:non-heme chloroperoxidase